MGFHKTPYGRLFPDTILRSSVAKIKQNLKMTVFQEMGIESKITQPNLMILVLFSSAEDALSNDEDKYNTFSSQGTKNPPFGSYCYKEH